MNDLINRQDACENACEITRKSNANDTISRQDALRFTNPKDWGTPDERWRPESEYGRYIQSLPSAEPNTALYIDGFNDGYEQCRQDAIERDAYRHTYLDQIIEVIKNLPSAEPEIVRCCKCGYWDRDSLRHQCNDFRDWNEAECKILADRDPYHEINRYTEADDFCSYAERKTDE